VGRLVRCCETIREQTEWRLTQGSAGTVVRENGDALLGAEVDPRHFGRCVESEVLPFAAGRAPSPPRDRVPRQPQAAARAHHHLEGRVGALHDRVLNQHGENIRLHQEGQGDRAAPHSHA